MHRLQSILPDQRSAATLPNRRIDNLAIAYQELLTIIVRLRTGRYPVHDAAGFRTQFIGGLKTAQNAARSRGYSDEDIRVTTFAVVGFLDESILNRNPDFADWILRPLQQELFGVMIAGETFFRNIDHLLNRADSQELADVLEIYALCLLLGFRGRYGLAETASLRAIAATLNDRIRRIRGASWPSGSAWRPAKVAVLLSDSVLHRLSWTAIAIWLLAIGLFLAYFLVLRSIGSQIAAGASTAQF